MLPADSHGERLVPGLLAGVATAVIGALYTVYAQWGIARGMSADDMTFLRFAVSGVVMAPVLCAALLRNARELIGQWRAWLYVCVLGGPLFGVTMFTALQWAEPSHATVVPFAAMSVMGTVLASWIFKEAFTARKLIGIAMVIVGLCFLSGFGVSAQGWRAIQGDALFVVAGALWAGFGIALRRYRLDPLLTTAVVSMSALITYVPWYGAVVGTSRLFSVPARVLWVEILVQGLIAGVGTLYAYSRTVALLGPARAAVIPSLAPGFAALLAWPVLGHVPSSLEAVGTLIVMWGLFVAVTKHGSRKIGAYS